MCPSRAIPTHGLGAPKDALFYSDLGYKLDQFARFGEATLPVSGAVSVTAGLRYYHLSEDKEQEKMWSYEVGYKSRVLNGTGAFNIAAFHMDIHDLQATVTAGSCSFRVIFNVPRAHWHAVHADRRR